MKRFLCLFVVLILLLTTMSGCSFFVRELSHCEVKFYVDGELYETKTVTLGETVKAPEPPEKKNEIFVGWEILGIASQKFDFSKKIIGNLVLHARYEIDAVPFTNMITKETINSIVTIRNRCYNTIDGTNIETSGEMSQGSGVVIDISNGYGYVLTNYHVVNKLEKYDNQEFSIEDPWGNTYEAKIYKKEHSINYAMSEDYDLALLYFKYSSPKENSLKEIVMGQNPKAGDFVAALGTPGGLQNAISYGKVVKYQQLVVSESSSIGKIDFEVILHNSPIDHGSSGGALINTRGELVGINFAGNNDGSYGCAIPIEKVQEFLSYYVYGK